MECLIDPLLVACAVASIEPIQNRREKGSVCTAALDEPDILLGVVTVRCCTHCPVCNALTPVCNHAVPSDLISCVRFSGKFGCIYSIELVELANVLRFSSYVA